MTSSLPWLVTRRSACYGWGKMSTKRLKTLGLGVESQSRINVVRTQSFSDVDLDLVISAGDDDRVAVQHASAGCFKRPRHCGAGQQRQHHLKHLGLRPAATISSRRCGTIRFYSRRACRSRLAKRRRRANRKPPGRRNRPGVVGVNRGWTLLDGDKGRIRGRVVDHRSIGEEQATRGARGHRRGTDGDRF